MEPWIELQRCDSSLGKDADIPGIDTGAEGQNTHRHDYPWSERAQDRSRSQGLRQGWEATRPASPVTALSGVLAGSTVTWDRLPPVWVAP